MYSAAMSVLWWVFFWMSHTYGAFCSYHSIVWPGVHEMHIVWFAASVSANASVSSGPPMTAKGCRSRAMVSASAVAATASLMVPVAL